MEKQEKSGNGAGWLSRFIHNHMGEQVELRDRLFYLVTGCVTLASFFSYVMTFFTGVPKISQNFSLICFLFMLSVMIWSFFTRHKQLLCIIVFLLLDLVLFPLTYFCSGGIYSGMPAYFMFICFLIAILVDGTARRVLLLLSVASFLGDFILEWYHPEWIVRFTYTGAFGDISSTVVILSLITSAITAMVYGEYRKYYNKATDLNIALLKSARTDSLTGLSNREHLINTISELMESGTDFQTALFDIDDFKKINDDFGHITGDTVLVAFADILKRESREGTAARYGGDEFVVIMPAVSRGEMEQIAERIRIRSEKMLREFCGRTVTVSCGIHRYRKGENLDRIIGSTDRSLYRAKHYGKNTVCSDDENTDQ